MGLRAFLASFLLCSCIGCVLPPPRQVQQPAPPEPCKPNVPPITGVSVIVMMTFNFAYTPKDASGGRDALHGLAMAQLNSLGAPDRNTFVDQNGTQTNFTLNFSLSNDGQDHYTGSVALSGWGWGSIHTFSRYQFPYNDPIKLTSDLTSDVYTFIHGGWHDIRPQCAPGYQPPTKSRKK